MKLYLNGLEVKSNQLSENTTYIIDFETENLHIIKNEIRKSKLTEFIDWIPGNKQGSLRICNKIGIINFFSRSLDVKSSKFLLDKNGEEQISILIKDIQEITKNCIYDFASPVLLIGDIDYNLKESNKIQQFNYYKNIIINWPKKRNFETLLNIVIEKSNNLYEHHYKQEYITKIRKTNNKTIQSIFSKSDTLTIIEDSNHLSNSTLAKNLKINSSKFYFPKKILNKEYFLSTNTPENQFVKYLLLHIQQLSQYMIKKNISSNLNEDAKQINQLCVHYLSKPFFKNISRMYQVPQYSTVLRNRLGYRDLFYHYVKSRFGIKQLLHADIENFQAVGLKNISELYEYWTFFQIAKLVFNKDIVIQDIRELNNLDSGIKYGLTLSSPHKDVFLHYNQTESKKRKTSYSVELRPDITIEFSNGAKYVFDAKYRVKNNFEEVRYYNSADVVKMHAYLDAIENCKFAIELYPGTELCFYEKDVHALIKTSVNDIDTYLGVGAFPLIPNTPEMIENLKVLISELFKKNLYRNIGA